MPSEGEGFGLPVAEAAWYGCPLLLRDIPVFRELADGHATFFTGLAPSDSQQRSRTGYTLILKAKFLPQKA